MGSLLFSVLVGVSSGFDNVDIGLSYTRHKNCIPWLFYIFVSLISFTGCVFGGEIALRIGLILSGFASGAISSFIFISIGIWMAIQMVYMKSSGLGERIGFNEKMFILLAEGLADLAIGFGTGFARQHVLGTATCVGIISFLFLVFPAYVGRRIPFEKAERVTKLIIGILLIAVGVLLYFDSL